MPGLELDGQLAAVSRYVWYGMYEYVRTFYGWEKREKGRRVRPMGETGSKTTGRGGPWSGELHQFVSRQWKMLDGSWSERARTDRGPSACGLLQQRPRVGHDCPTLLTLNGLWVVSPAPLSWGPYCGRPVQTTDNRQEISKHTPFLHFG